MSVEHSSWDKLGHTTRYIPLFMYFMLCSKGLPAFTTIVILSQKRLNVNIQNLLSRNCCHMLHKPLYKSVAECRRRRIALQNMLYRDCVTKQREHSAPVDRLIFPARKMEVAEKMSFGSEVFSKMNFYQPCNKTEDFGVT